MPLFDDDFHPGISDFDIGMRAKPGFQFDIPKFNDSEWNDLKKQARSNPDAVIESCKKQMTKQEQFYESLLKQLSEISASASASAEAAKKQAESSCSQAKSAQKQAEASAVSTCASKSQAESAHKIANRSDKLSIIAIIISALSLLFQYVSVHQQIISFFQPLKN